MHNARREAWRDLLATYHIGHAPAAVKFGHQAAAATRRFTHQVALARCHTADGPDNADT